MKNYQTIFIISSGIIILGWLAKIHFIPGGDIAFRLGTIGVISSIVTQVIAINKILNKEDKMLKRLFNFNSAALGICYTGMMLKVSHIMSNQIQKDIVFDFIGIPIIVTAIIYSTINIDVLGYAKYEIKIIFIKNIILQYSMFLLSVILYCIYSSVLASAAIANNISISAS